MTANSFGPCTFNTLLLLLWLLKASVLASPTVDRSTGRKRDTPDQSPFGWKKCPNSNDDRWSCGSIKVPYDYHNPADNRSMQIETVLFQVGKERSNHTVLVNPGGPGSGGVEYAWYDAEFISVNYTDSKYDILGFDPRGVNASEPHIYCYPNYAFHDRWAALGSYYQERGDKEFDLQYWDSSAEAFFKACREKYGDLGNYLTTVSTVRDMDFIRAALNEEKLYFLGFSYGTALGQTYAQLFPDRVGRIMLDAVQDIVGARTTSGFGSDQLIDRDRVYNEGFIGECIRAGPENCALAKPLTNQDGPETVEGLKKRLDNIFANLRNRPVPVTDPHRGPAVYRWRDFNYMLASTLYGPEDWQTRASVIADYERNGNTSYLYRFKTALTFDAEPEKCPELPEKAWGDVFLFIVCGDAYDAYYPGADYLDFYLNLWRDMSDKSFIGADPDFLTVQPCRHYDWKPVEVYRGDLSANLSHPILLISTALDPATPLTGGMNAYKALGRNNARLVIHHGYGHGSLRLVSQCTQEIKRKYMTTGEVPEGEEPTNCYTEETPYPPPGTEPQLVSHELSTQPVRLPPWA